MTLIRLKACLGVLGLVAVPLAIGCSSTIIEDDDDGDGGATSATTTTTSTSGTTTSTKASSSSGGACDGFEDVAAGTPITIRVVNQTFQPIYLPVNCGAPSFGIRSGPPNNGDFPGQRSCLQTCEDLKTSGHFDCGACAPESQRIEPGGTFDISWDGLGLLGTTMPLACFHSPNEGDTCQQMVAALAGAIYSVDLTARSSCGEDVDCVCDPSGLCNGNVSGQSASLIPSATEFVLGGAPIVQVVFDMCAFGCPEN